MAIKFYIKDSDKVKTFKLLKNTFEELKSKLSFLTA